MNNYGDQPLLLDTILIDGNSNFTITNLLSNTFINSCDNVSFQVSYTPDCSSPNIDSANVVIYTNEPDSPFIFKVEGDANTNEADNIPPSAICKDIMLSVCLLYTSDAADE